MAQNNRREVKIPREDVEEAEPRFGEHLKLDGLEH